ETGIVRLPTRKVEIDSEMKGFELHKRMLLKSYLGYQVMYGLSRRRLVEDCLALWLHSYYWKQLPDEEPYLHFIFSRFQTAGVSECVYQKDMTHSLYYKMGFAEAFMPMCW